MILYVNGDSHSAAAQAVNDFSFANDDFARVALGRKPHPDNLAASYGMHLSKMLKLALVCEAEAGCSNERILRITKEFLKKQHQCFVVIGWANPSKIEFWDSQENEMLQVDMLFPNSVPRYLEKEFRKHIVNLDIKEQNQRWHDSIYNLHQELTDADVPHLFFNSSSNFNSIPKDRRKDWNNRFIDPYNSSYIEKLESAGFQCNDWQNFHDDAHFYWAKFLENWLTDNNLFV